MFVSILCIIAKEMLKKKINCNKVILVHGVSACLPEPLPAPGTLPAGAAACGASARCRLRGGSPAGARCAPGRASQPVARQKGLPPAPAATLRVHPRTGGDGALAVGCRCAPLRPAGGGGSKPWRPGWRRLSQSLAGECWGGGWSPQHSRWQPAAMATGGSQRAVAVAVTAARAMDVGKWGGEHPAATPQDPPTVPAATPGAPPGFARHVFAPEC